MNKEKFAHTNNTIRGVIRKGTGQAKMRNNARFYLYIGVGAIAIVILAAWLVAMINNNRGVADENNNTRLEQQSQQDKNTNKDTAQQNNGGEHQDVLDVPVNDDPMMDANAGDMDYMPEAPEDSLSEESEEELPEEDTVDVGANTYTFHAGSILRWPVKGNVIMNYSMDKMIYFETLDVYKYHPAICVQAEEGTPVVAGATGEVISVSEEPDTGLTVGMRIGTEYVIYYGHLKDCDLKVGDHVNRGQEFAKVAAPTKYFLIEGSHLYLRLERNEEPVNPLSYLDFSE